MKLRILFIEDEPLARWTGAKMLSAFDADVTIAESLAQAGALWQGNEFDVVVSDYRLEDGLATELIASMRSAGQNTPAVCLTGEVEDISEADRDRLSIMAVLKKPMDEDRMRELLASVRAVGQAPAMQVAGGSASNAVAGAEWANDADEFEFPIWVSSTWGAAVSPGVEESRLVVALGREGDVWLLALACAETNEREALDARRLAQAFRVLARWMPDGATAGEMLARCVAVAGTGRGEHEWDLMAVRLHAGTVVAAANRPGGWSVFFSTPEDIWVALQSGPRPALPVRTNRFLVVADPERDLQQGLQKAGGGGQERVEALWNMACKGGLNAQTGFAAAFWPREPERELRPFAGINVTSNSAGPGLARMERVLREDGVDRLVARRLCCGLMDLIEGGVGDRVRVQWGDGRAQVVLDGVGAPAHEFVRFFSAIDARTDGSIFVVVKGAQPENAHVDTRPVFRYAGVRRAGIRNGRVGRFTVVPVPPALDEAATQALSDHWQDEAWLALDVSALRYLSSRALDVIIAMAVARRGAAGSQGGQLCLTAYSTLMGRLFRAMTVDCEVDLSPTLDGLESLGRRMTSASERTALLSSIV